MQTLNDTFSEELKTMLGSPSNAVSDAAFISIDRLGTDVRVRQGTDYSVQRIGFEQVRRLGRPRSGWCAGRVEVDQLLQLRRPCLSTKPSMINLQSCARYASLHGI